MSKFDKIEELQGLVKEDPENYRARQQLAVLLMDCGFNDEALQHLLYLSGKFENDDGVLYNLGIVYEKLKKFDKAKESYEKAVKIKPEATDTIYNLGLVYIELKEYDKAIKCFEQVIQTDSEDSNSYFNIGLAYFKKKDYLNAVEYFQKTVDLNDEDIYAHFYIGNIMKEFGDLDSAKEKFEKVLEISPDYSWAYYNLAVIYYEEGSMFKAIDNLKQTVKLNPVDLDAYKILIKILSSVDKYEDAADFSLQAIENCGESGDLCYLISQVYRLCGNKEEYKRYLSDAIRNYQTLSIPVTQVKEELRGIEK